MTEVIELVIDVVDAKKELLELERDFPKILELSSDVRNRFIDFFEGLEKLEVNCDSSATSTGQFRCSVQFTEEFREFISAVSVGDVDFINRKCNVT